MKHIFYFMVLMLAIYELMKASNCKKMYKRVSECRKLDKDTKLEYLKAHPMFYGAILIDLLECLVVTSGVLSSQWICFVFIIFLSLSHFTRLGAWAVCVDGIVAAAVYIFATLNTYHLHITFF